MLNRCFILFLIVLGFIPSNGFTQENADDQLTTTVVAFQTKKAYQLDLWIDGKRFGYAIPGNVELTYGKHFVSAGHPDIVPVLTDINVERKPGGRQVILLDADLLTPKNFETAFAKVSTAYKKHPDNKHIMLLAASMTPDFSDFVNLIGHMPEEMHDHSTIRMSKARWAIDLNNLEDAEILLNELVEEFPTLACAWKLRARLLLKKGELESAITAANRAIALEAANPWNFVSRGNAYMLLGETYNAQLDYERALELDPENPRAIMGLERVTSEDKQ